MKKIILAALVIGIAVASANAQDIPQRNHEGVKKERKGGRPGKMADLNLTAEQKAQYKTLHEEHRKQMQELSKQDNITVKESREKRKELMTAYQQKSAAILTPEQREKQEAARKERMEKGKERMEKGREKMEARKAAMEKELDLTADQKSALETSRKASAEKLKAIRSNESLSAEQKKEQSKAVMSEQKATHDKVLTAEQKKKMEERKAKSPRGKSK